MKLSFGPSARELGILYAHIRVLSLAGKIKYETVGIFKFIDRADLPAVRQAAIDTGYIRHNPKPDAKDYPAWLRAMGWENDEAGMSEKLRANMLAWFESGYEPIEPADAMPGPVHFDSRVNIPLASQLEAAAEVNPEANA